MNHTDSERQPVIRTLAFHKLLGRFSYSASNCKPDRFHRLLEDLISHGFSLQNAPTDELSLDQAHIQISFDDGYGHLLDLLPDLMTMLKFKPL
ncbi:MAG: hypothetical protein V3T31_09595, partial [candidate division Zixibacteria bacterium]